MGLFGSAGQQLAGSTHNGLDFLRQLFGMQGGQPAMAAPGGIQVQQGDPMGAYDPNNAGYQPQLAPQQPMGMIGGSAPRQDRTSPLAYIDQVVFGGRFGQAQDREHQRAIERQMEPQTLAYIASLPADERAAYLANPAKWSENKSTLYGAHNINAGGVFVGGMPGAAGTKMVGAPTVQTQDGRSVITNPLDSSQTVNDYGPSTLDQAKLDQPVVVGNSLVTKTGDPLYTAPMSVATGNDVISPPVPGHGASGSAPGLTLDGVTSGITTAIPGAKITSTVRSPEHNAAVGGVANSLHLSGHAVDFVPPDGMTLDQAGEVARKQFPGAEVIIERGGNGHGPHIHMEWKGGGQGGKAGGVIYSNPKEGYRPATAEEKAQFGLSPDVPAKMGPNGLEVISGVGANNKHPPPNISGGYAANLATIAQIDKTIAAIKANPGALGLQNKLGDDVMQRVDPKGQGTRSMVAALGAAKRHEVSGAAVTFSEKPDLMPFVPGVSDTADAAIAKLEKMKDNLIQTNVEMDTVYGPDNGYAPMSGGGQQRQAASQQPQGQGNKYGNNASWLTKQPEVKPARDNSGDLYYHVERNDWRRIDIDPITHKPFIILKDGSRAEVTPH